MGQDEETIYMEHKKKHDVEEGDFYVYIHVFQKYLISF